MDTTQTAGLLMSNISKRFPGVLAVDNVNFEAKKGEVTALVGANGAGKSTLMKVLSGAYAEYEGTISIENVEVAMTNPIVAKRRGILCIYQEVDTSLVPYLNVSENIFMDRMAMESKGIRVDWKTLGTQAKAILADMGVEMNVNKLVSQLTLSEKQLLLIARALSMDIKFLILDEPTAPLSLHETEKLFEIIKRLQKKNVGIIYISHRLSEVLEITDRITVMKNGSVTANLITKETTKEKIIESMLGGSFEAEYPKLPAKIGGEIFRAEDICFENSVRNVSFSLKSGEILGIAGLVGAGKTELSKALFGAKKRQSGNIYVKGKKTLIRQPDSAIKQGLALIPEERRKEGIMVAESVTSNLTIASIDQFTKLSFMNTKKEKETSQKMVNNIGIKTPSITQLVKNLSGGNQQKVSIGKWLVNDAEVYLFDEPTKGVDVGAKTEIFRLVGELAANGKGIIYLSNELEEIVGIADRTLIMYDGKVVKELSRDEMSLERLLYYCTGGTDDE